MAFTIRQGAPHQKRRVSDLILLGKGHFNRENGIFENADSSNALWPGEGINHSFAALNSNHGPHRLGSSKSLGDRLILLFGLC